MRRDRMVFYAINLTWFFRPVVIKIQFFQLSRANLARSLDLMEIDVRKMCMGF